MASDKSAIHRALFIPSIWGGTNPTREANQAYRSDVFLTAIRRNALILHE